MREEIIPLYLSKGATIDEARDYCVSGCTEARMPNRDTYLTGGANLNLGAMLELALSNGKMKSYGDRQLGIKMGDPRGFKTFDNVWNAFCLQVKNIIKHTFIA